MPTMTEQPRRRKTWDEIAPKDIGGNKLTPREAKERARQFSVAACDELERAASTFRWLFRDWPLMRKSDKHRLRELSQQVSELYERAERLHNMIFHT
ncbi:unnamed protein product [uncultured bacterium]|nr:unnamed protein product [uncultured bacterium]